MWREKERRRERDKGRKREREKERKGEREKERNIHTLVASCKRLSIHWHSITSIDR